MRTFILFCLIFYTSFAEVVFEYTEVITLSGGSTYNEIQDLDESGFLTVCTNSIKEIYPNDNNDVQCIAVAESTAANNYIDVTVGSNTDGMILNVKMAIVNNGLNALVYGDYVLYETNEVMTINYVNSYATWTDGLSESDLANFPAVCEITLQVATCSDPMENEDGNVQIAFTVTASNYDDVYAIVNDDDFTVLGYKSLEAVADPSTCEKIDQADLVIWVNDDGTLFSSKDEEMEAGSCFDELPQMQAQDRTYIDDMANYNLKTTIAVFAKTDEITDSIVTTIKGFGYQTVYDAGSYNAVQAARQGHGCECALAQPVEVVEVEVEDYDIDAAGLAVGIAGVVVFFAVCIFCVRMRDNCFGDQEEVSKQMQEQQDILEKIRQTEEASTMGEKNLPEWPQPPYQPSQTYWDKEICRVTNKKGVKEMMSETAQEEVEV